MSYQLGRHHARTAAAVIVHNDLQSHTRTAFWNPMDRAICNAGIRMFVRCRHQRRRSHAAPASQARLAMNCLAFNVFESGETFHGLRHLCLPALCHVLVSCGLGTLPRQMASPVAQALHLAAPGQQGS
jgi:hypothetical protein